MKNSTNLMYALVYTTIIAVVLLWSSQDREKSIYNKHLIFLKGIEIQVTDLKASEKIFTDVLELEKKSESLTHLEYGLPDKRSIFLVNSELTNKTVNLNTNSQKQITIHIRVKNGLSQLRNKLIKSYNEKIKDNNAEVISEIGTYKGRIEFSLTAPDQIKFIFSQKKLF